METKIKNPEHITLTDEGYHQSLMNRGYAEWNLKDASNESVHPRWTYPDMLEWIRDEHGDFAAALAQIGKINQQVTNGGWAQCIANDYAGEHILDLLTIRQNLLDIGVTGQLVDRFTENLHAVIGVIDEVVECPHCHTSLSPDDIADMLSDDGPVTRHQTILNNLDTQFYCFNESLMAQIDTGLARLLLPTPRSRELFWAEFSETLTAESARLGRGSSFPRMHPSTENVVGPYSIQIVSTGRTNSDRDYLMVVQHIVSGQIFYASADPAAVGTMVAMLVP